MHKSFCCGGFDCLLYGVYFSFELIPLLEMANVWLHRFMLRSLCNSSAPVLLLLFFFYMSYVVCKVFCLRPLGFINFCLHFCLPTFFIIVFLPKGLYLDICVVLATQTEVFSYSLLSISNFVYAYCVVFHKFLSTFLFAYIFYYCISFERFMLRSLCRFGNTE